MKKDQEMHDFVVHDLLGTIPGITSKAMFGGWGIYKDGYIFAIIADGELYFKVGESTKADFESHGSHPFAYVSGGEKNSTMSYWLVPEEILEDSETLHTWVDNAVTVSKAAKQSSKKK